MSAIGVTANHVNELIVSCCQGSCAVYNFYRAMHFSAKRGIAIACRLSVCLSVCNVGEL